MNKTKRFKKLKPIITQILITIVLIVVVGFQIMILGKDGITPAILMSLCWINNIAFIIQIKLLKRVFESYINPLVLFSIFLFLFSSGQLVLYSLNIDIDGFSLFNRVQLDSIGYSLPFLILGYAFYQLGVIKAITKDNIYIKEMPKHITQKNNVIFKMGIIFILIGIIPYTVFLINNLIVVLTQGYKAYYKAGVRLNSIFIGLGYYLFTGLICVTVSGNKRQKNISIVAILFIALIRLISGDRGDGIVFIFTAFLLYVYFIEGARPKLSQVVVVAFVSMLFVPIVSATRHAVNSNISRGELIINALKENNIVISTLSNLGGTLFPLAKIMELAPLYQDYIKGGSYLAAFVLIIPSPLRFGILSEVTMNNLYSSPANWLMNSLNMTYGPGFTPFAESYLNFGWLGIIFMSGYGFLIAKLISRRARNAEEIPFMRGLGILTFTFFAMGTRGSFNYMIAYYFRYVLIPYLFIEMMSSKINKKMSK